MWNKSIEKTNGLIYLKQLTKKILKNDRHEPKTTTKLKDPDFGQTHSKCGGVKKNVCESFLLTREKYRKTL